MFNVYVQDKLDKERKQKRSQEKMKIEDDEKHKRFNERLKLKYDDKIKNFILEMAKNPFVINDYIDKGSLKQPKDNSGIKTGREYITEKQRIAKKIEEQEAIERLNQLIMEKKPKVEEPPNFVQPQMRFTSKSNIERIIEIYSRTHTKDSRKLANFINHSQSEGLKKTTKEKGIEETDASVTKSPEGIVTYEEMKRKKELEKEAEKRLKMLSNSDNTMKMNKYYYQKKRMNDEATRLLSDNIVKMHFKGTSSSIVLGGGGDDGGKIQNAKRSLIKSNSVNYLKTSPKDSDDDFILDRSEKPQITFNLETPSEKNQSPAFAYLCNPPRVEDKLKKQRIFLWKG